MAFAFACKVLGVKCDWEATAPTRNELMAKIRQHGKEGKHSVSEIVAGQAVRNVGSSGQ